MRTLFAVTALVTVSLAAQPVQKGAKALFLDTQTGKLTMPTVTRPATKSETRPVEVPAITGLMYYMELVSPNGELTRLNSNSTFHSGEKFRVHVTSNIDGWLTILQSQDAGRFEKLFPSASFPNLASNVKRGVLIRFCPHREGGSNSMSGQVRFDCL